MLKFEQKKMAQLLDNIAQQILILRLKMITQGQNEMSWALIWCIVSLDKKWPEIWSKSKNTDLSNSSIYETKIQENAKSDIS